MTISEGYEEIRALLGQARDEDVIVRMDVDGSEHVMRSEDNLDHEILAARGGPRLLRREHFRGTR